MIPVYVDKILLSFIVELVMRSFCSYFLGVTDSCIPVFITRRIVTGFSLSNFSFVEVFVVALVSRVGAMEKENCLSLDEEN